MSNIITNPHDKDLSKLASYEGLMNNPNISDYAVKSNQGQITKPKLNMKTKQEQIYTAQDAQEFLKDRVLPIKTPHDRVLLIEVHENETDIFKKTDSGLFVEGGENKRGRYGKYGERDVTEEHRWGKFYVVQAGPGYSNVPMEAKAGDIVLVGHFIGNLISYEGVDYKIVRDMDCMLYVPK